MSKVLWANNAGTTLAFSISNVDTTATLASGTGAKFPSPTGGDYFTMTFSDSGFTIWEIVNVFSRTGDVITFTRAQEGTAALAWTAGDPAQNLLTAASLATLLVSAVGGVLTGFLPNPGMAAGAAAANVGSLGGILTGFLPAPGIAINAFLPGTPTTSNSLSLTDSSSAIATTNFANPNGSNIADPNGFKILPGGYIEQWFVAGVPAGGGTQTTFVRYPITFPTQCVDVQISFNGNTPPGPENPGSMSINTLDRFSCAVTTNYPLTVTFGIRILCRGY